MIKKKEKGKEIVSLNKDIEEIDSFSPSYMVAGISRL
jgi:hypothetical protein